jgi:mono/diheme cytochrome c family protein
MKLRIAVLCSAAVALAGCAGQTTRSTPFQVFQDMDWQPRFGPQQKSTFFSDGRSSRVPVPGTVAKGMLKEEDGRHYFTGLVNGQYIGRNPLTVDMELLRQGQRRFNTYCSPCHDRTGQGRGIVAQRAMWIPTNLTEERIRDFNDGEIFNVISHGRRSMPPYRFQITEHDRWAIVAYVRALQRSAIGTVEDVPQELRTDLR